GYQDRRGVGQGEYGLADYAARPATAWEHAAEIRRHYGYHDFSDPTESDAKLDAAGDAIRAVLGHDDRRLAFLGAVLDAVNRVAQRARGAPADRLDDRLLVRPAQIDEWFGVGPEHRCERVRTEPGVLADAAIVEDAVYNFFRRRAVK